MNLTIVIPVYNVRFYLNECLDSLPDNCDVVLVNDGSTDGSDIICKEFAKMHPNVTVIDKVNGGLADARNYGMQFVKTEYVFFLDSDDTIDAKNLIAALKFANNNNLDWVQCGYAYDYGEKLLTFRQNTKPQICKKVDITYQLVNDSFVKNFAWGKIYRTEIIRRFEFPKGKFFEDSYWQYRIVDESKSFGIFPEIVTYYRQRQESISGSFSIRNMDLLEGLSQRLDFYIAHPAKYSPFIGIAAVNLWTLAESYIDIAIQISSDLGEIYFNASNKIKDRYHYEIDSGIALMPLFMRLELKSLMKRRTFIAHTLNLCRKIIGRFNPSKYQYVTKPLQRKSND